MSNTGLVKAVYNHFSTGNVPVVLALFDPAIEWRACTGVRFVKGDGIFIGSEAVVATTK